MNFFDSIGAWWQDSVVDPFVATFITQDRYKMILEGLGNTLLITLFAAIIGIALGFIIAAVRTTHDLRKDELTKKKGLGSFLLKFFNGVCKLYLTIFRGTPIVVQLLILYFIILTSVVNALAVAIVGFGLNSAAYVAEIFRSGIMSIDRGQNEAGRSLGLNYFQTMIFIILPQAIKNVLPALLNEFIALLKETSVVGYIAGTDLTRAAMKIQTATYEPFFPYISIAVIYLVIVIILTKLVGIVERRLRKSEH